MEEEIQGFIKVWLTVIASLCYSYTIGNFTTKPTLRLISILPAITLFFYLPLNLTSVNLIGYTSFFVTWLANFKLLLFCFSKGPLSSDPRISLLRFIALACLPIKIQQTHYQKLPNKQHSLLGYAAKGVLLALLIRIYDYNEYINHNLILGLYCFHIYFSLDIILALVAAAARALLNIELEPQFNEPYFATSLQDFWGRRWNLMVSSILRPTVYEPTIQICTRWIGRKWASLPAIFASFLVSGLMHELIIFYFGHVKPTWEITWFFVLHGVCLVVEVAIKKVVNGRWKLPRFISGLFTLGFVMVTSFWLFFPQFLQCNADARALAEYAALAEFVKDVGGSILALVNSFNQIKS